MSALDDVITVLKQYNELKQAKSLLDTFSKYASNIQEYDILGKAYYDIKFYKDAINWTLKALTISPDNNSSYSIRANLAKLYNHINDPKQALFYLNINDKLNPNNPEVMLEKVFSLFLLNKKVESEAILREMIELDLDEQIRHRVLFNLGTYDLYAGKFQKGLRGFLLEGKKLDIWKKITLPFQYWDGGIQLGKTILIVAEGGIGDEFINVRFCKKFEEYGMNPIWYTTRQDIAKLFKSNGINVVTNLKELNKDILWTYSMSLPIFLDLQEKDLWDGPYLKPSVEATKRWAWMIDNPLSKNNPLVGLRWTGNPEYEQDLHRSIPLSEIFKVIENKDYKLISLQRDEGADDVQNFPDILDLQHEFISYDDTLACINNLDIVITSCTSIAHAASALGKRTFVLVPVTAYYTWASTTDTSTIWYGDNVTILRQVVHKSWQEPLEQLAEYLK